MKKIIVSICLLLLLGMSTFAQRCTLSSQKVKYLINSSNFNQGQELNSSDLLAVGDLQELGGTWVRLFISQENFIGLDVQYGGNQYQIEVTPLLPFKNGILSEEMNVRTNIRLDPKSGSELRLWAVTYQKKQKLASVKIECEGKGLFSNPDDIYFTVKYSEGTGWTLEYEIK